MAIFSAISPVIGSMIAENFGWASIFLFLICFAIAITILVILKLPETLHKNNRKPVSILEIGLSLIRNK